MANRGAFEREFEALKSYILQLECSSYYFHVNNFFLLPKKFWNEITLILVRIFFNVRRDYIIVVVKGFCAKKNNRRTDVGKKKSPKKILKMSPSLRMNSTANPLYSTSLKAILKTCLSLVLTDWQTAAVDSVFMTESTYGSADLHKLRSINPHPRLPVFQILHFFFFFKIGQNHSFGILYFLF